MPDFYSVIIQDEWIDLIKPYLDHLEKDEHESKLVARRCLEEFSNVKSTMEVMKTDWAQGSFSTDQMNLIRSIATYLEIEVAERRFTI